MVNIKCLYKFFQFMIQKVFFYTFKSGFYFHQYTEGEIHCEKNVLIVK